MRPQDTQGDLRVAYSEVVLASASPRRTQLLAALGVSHRVAPADIDETPQPGEPPGAYVRRMAGSKAAAGVAVTPDVLVLAADTIVVSQVGQNEHILGKPADRREGVAMLNHLSGRSHRVLTAVCVRRGDCMASACVETRVWFRSVSVQEALQYWDTGEPQDKAGGYGIQGHASIFVTKIDGSYSNVIGLPLVETRTLLVALAGSNALSDEDA